MKPNLVFINNQDVVNYLISNGVSEFGGKPNCFDINLLNKKELSIDDLKLKFTNDIDIIYVKDNINLSKVKF